jgi:hypothetical protein
MNTLQNVAFMPSAWWIEQGNLELIDPFIPTVGTAAERVAIIAPGLWRRFFQTDGEAGLWLFNGRNWMPATAVYCVDTDRFYRQVLRLVGGMFENTLDTDNPL